MSAAIPSVAAVLDRLDDAVLLCRADTSVVYWNSAAAELHRIPAGAAPGLDWFDLAGRVAGGDLGDAWHEVLETGSWKGELRLDRSGGVEAIVASRWHRLPAENGAAPTVLVLGTDVTESRRLESAFYRVQRLECLGTLAGGIAHDLNNVLTPILLTTNFLRSSLTGPEEVNLVDSLQAAAQRGRDLVRQILSFARGTDERRIAVQLHLIVQEMERVLRSTLPRSIELHTEWEADLPPVLGDATQIYQALMNLCLNARDAMPFGGKLLIRVASFDADESYRRSHPHAVLGHHVALEVADTGVGIPPEQLERIFDQFFTTKEPSRGTGLGLATVHSVVKGHGGFVEVLSEPGEGTVFRIFLPAAESPSWRQEAVAAGPPPPGRGQTILVAEDDPDVLEPTVAALRGHGYRVLEARDGEEAIAVFTRERPRIDAVLCDQDMPRLEGLAALRSMKHLAPDLKALLASGHPLFTPALESIAVLRKPWSSNELLSAVGELFAGGSPSPAAAADPPARQGSRRRQAPAKAADR